MANPCDNVITITGSKDGLRKIKCILKQWKEGDELFPLFYPEPKNLSDPCKSADWREKNWGTQGTMDCVQMEIEDDRIDIVCDTADVPPFTFIKKLSRDFKVHVEMIYLGDGHEFAGKMICQNGKVILDEGERSPTLEYVNKIGWEFDPEDWYEGCDDVEE